MSKRRLTLGAAVAAVSVLGYHFFGPRKEGGTNTKNEQKQEENRLPPKKDRYYGLITGCSRGIGLNLVKTLMGSKENDYFIFATCRNPDKATDLQNVLKEYPSKLKLIPMDVSNEESVQTAFNTVNKELNGNILDILINNAGLGTVNHPWEYLSSLDTNRDVATKEEMLKLYETNVVGVLLVIQAFLPLLGENGRILNISSFLGSIEKTYVNIKEQGKPHMLSYRCSKAALNMLNTICSASEECANKNLIFTVIHPSWCNTDMGSSYGKREAPTKVEDACKGIVKVLESMTFKTHNGKFYTYTGGQLPW